MVNTVGKGKLFEYFQITRTHLSEIGICLLQKANPMLKSTHRVF